MPKQSVDSHQCKGKSDQDVFEKVNLKKFHIPLIWGRGGGGGG